MAVVNNIKEIREQRGIYQDELAEATGYCTKTIGRIERGESTPSTVATDCSNAPLMLFKSLSIRMFLI